MYRSGLSVGDVARAFQVTRQAMWKILKRRGVEFRSQLRFNDENHFFRGGPVKNASILVKRAIQRGLLVIQPCEICGLTPAIEKGRQRIQAHHDDYNHLLQIRWLCQEHHRQWHNENRPTPRTTPRLDRREVASRGGKASWSKHRETNLKQLQKARESVQRHRSENMLLD